METKEEILSEVPPNILLMEDEDNVGRGLQMVLTEAGYQVDWATSGMGALEKFRKKSFDLLMADLRLPDIDGIEVIKQIKKQRPETIVIVITGYAGVSSAVDAMKVGAFDYLAKPFTDDEIRAVVQEALKEKQSPSVPSPSGGTSPDSLDFSTERRPRILLVEDETSVARGLQMILTEAGYEVSLATAGKEAVDILVKNGVDLLIADLRLPDIDGMEVIRALMAIHPDTPVIVITGYATVSSAVDAMKLGVVEYLPKPFEEDEIMAAVREALRVKEASRIKEILSSVDSEEGKLIQKREVIRALDRASGDERFWRALLETGSAALKGYGLTLEAKAAIVSGDLNWIRKHAGELSDRQLQWIRSRLEMERW